MTKTKSATAKNATIISAIETKPIDPGAITTPNKHHTYKILEALGLKDVKLAEFPQGAVTFKHPTQNKSYSLHFYQTAEKHFVVERKYKGAGAYGTGQARSASTDRASWARLVCDIINEREAKGYVLVEGSTEWRDLDEGQAQPMPARLILPE